MKNSRFQIGISSHLVAKLSVVSFAYLLHFTLGRLLSVAEYGLIGTIITLSNFYYLFLTNGIRQSISNAIAINSFNTKDIIVKGITLQIGFALLLSIVNVFLAPTLSTLLGNEDYAMYYSFISVLIPFTALYFAGTGVLNGLKLFVRESLVTILYPFLRLSAILFILNRPQSKPMGVINGFILGSFITSLITWILIIRSTRKLTLSDLDRPRIKTTKLLKNSFSFIASFGAITIVLNLDTLFLQYIKKDLTLTGLYTGVHTFSLVPYYLVSAFYLVILPYISEYYEKSDKYKIRELLKKTVSIVMLFVFPIVFLISISGGKLLSLFYNPDYFVAGNALAILCMGTFILSIYAIFTVALIGLKENKKAGVCSLVLVVADIIFQFFFTQQSGLIGSASGTFVSSLISCLLIYYFLVVKTGNFIGAKLIYSVLIHLLPFLFLSVLILRVISITNLITLFLVWAGILLPYYLITIKMNKI
jgi:O-antigen/teichoic acid export membrane protein